jgi:hypothetical protein
VVALDVRLCANVTVVGIEAILRGCRRLTVLEVYGCETAAQVRAFRAMQIYALGVEGIAMYIGLGMIKAIARVACYFMLCTQPKIGWTLLFPAVPTGIYYSRFPIFEYWILPVRALLAFLQIPTLSCPFRRPCFLMSETVLRLVCL